MKPLPFDMTPLARSLSMAPASHSPSSAVRDVESPFRATQVKLPSAEDTAVEEAGRPESGDAPFASGMQFDAEAGAPEAARDASGAREAKPKKSKRESRAARKARERAERDAASGSPSRVPAERPQSAPATQLRRALYPTHVCAGKSWAGRLADEQIHALATHVLARHTRQNLRTLAVTSALAGEGKTTATLALAQKLAGADKRVLIIDLDTHRATLSHEAGLDDAAGALQSCDPTDVANLDFHAYETDIPGVTIMPVGHQPVGLMGPPLVSPVHTGVLILNALERFDIVILDCPPLLPVAETFVLREVVDAAIMVVRAGSTPRDMLDQAIDDFGREKFMGAILNRTKPGDIPYFREVYGYYRRDSSRG